IDQYSSYQMASAPRPRAASQAASSSTGMTSSQDRVDERCRMLRNLDGSEQQAVARLTCIGMRAGEANAVLPAVDNQIETIVARRQPAERNIDFLARAIEARQAEVALRDQRIGAVRYMQRDRIN